jgi:hypothetical protein
MVQRVAAFVAACLIGGASVSLTVCQVLCASHRQHPMHHAAHHSCAPSQTTTAAIAGVPHACGHNDDSDDVAVVQGNEIPLLPTVATFTAWCTAPADATSRLTSHVPAECSPPGLLEKAAQLRV